MGKMDCTQVNRRIMIHPPAAQARALEASPCVQQLFSQSFGPSLRRRRRLLRDRAPTSSRRKSAPSWCEHCYPCHSRQAGKERGDLLLDTRDGLRKGGESGSAIVPGKPGESLLIKLARHTDPKLRMPRKGKLDPEAIADLERWIAMGAPIRARETIAAKSIDFDAAAKHWAYQPIRKPACPPSRTRAGCKRRSMRSSWPSWRRRG